MLPKSRLLDLGCGFGGLLLQLAAIAPAGTVGGGGNCAAARAGGMAAAARVPECRVRRGDLWRLDLAQYDVVYAFLSPAPMSALWEKVRREMRPGTLFVSNSFPVPGVGPDRVIALAGRGARNLYVWRL